MTCLAVPPHETDVLPRQSGTPVCPSQEKLRILQRQRATFRHWDVPCPIPFTTFSPSGYFQNSTDDETPTPLASPADRRAGGADRYAAPAVPDTIPFEIGADRRIYVQVQLNGNTHRSFRFLFDTGATDIVLNASLPEVMAQAKFTQEVHNQGATSAEVIPSTSADQQLLLGHNNVKGLTFIAIAYPPEAWDGVLGLSFMKCFDIAIDYNRRQMYLYPPGKAPRPGKKGLPFTYRAGVPVVPVVAYINGKRHALQVELDSGSDRVLDINTPYVERHRLRGTLPVFAVSSIAGTGTANGQLENVFFDKLTLGPATFPLLPGAFSTLKSGLQASAEMDGVAGNNLLQRFNQLWDFRNQKLYLTVNHRYYLPFYDFLTAP